MYDLITWISHWPEWTGAPIGVGLCLAAFFYLKHKWEL